jgi:hypothetical protein
MISPHQCKSCFIFSDIRFHEELPHLNSRGMKRLMQLVADGQVSDTSSIPVITHAVVLQSPTITKYRTVKINNYISPEYHRTKKQVMN